ncbi:gluconolaconase [Sphingomonas ginkgonis]|uniref:Gluconolaconase n=1 Tax=Sphingomonas ginkgonis TaxID=2315330 RepID=A0A429V9M3_9SPHN|nr:glycosyl hydrolase family 28-related protein [Sphingomonas ginkgonis]RST30634.1 gluconolaconase [Sphingomonas ginkgonis]
MAGSIAVAVLAAGTLCVQAGPALASPSVLTSLPDDPRAVRVAGVGNGVADDSGAIQQAIDQAASRGGGGIVFLPAGRYRISRTILLWPGVRLLGIGKRRPTLVLGDHTPGFQQGIANMVIFAGARPGSETSPRRPVPFPPPGSVPFDKDLADANPGTFYSALSNIDFRIGAGNPAAAAIRFHSAQHSFVSHADFDLGSGFAGLYQVGNAGEDLHFRGGRYGIVTEKPSPAWGFALVDSSFEGQRDAAIREHEAGLTLLNVSFRDTPVGIEVDRGYGDWLFGKGVRFDRVASAGVVISNEKNVYTQVGFEDVVATGTPNFVRYRDSGRVEAAPARTYRVASFSYGLTLPSPTGEGEYKSLFRAEPMASRPRPVAPVLRPLPPPSTWANVRTLGAKGDDRTDDRAAIQAAIDAHRVVYFPAGFYRVSDTLRLRHDSVLIGLHPGLTQILLPEHAPAFQGLGTPRPLLQSAKGGDAIVSGLGLATGGTNPRATGLYWMAGERSQISDVKFQGGHGTDLFDGTRFNPYDATASGDPDPAKRWGGQYASLWVTNGGGGTIFNVWSPNTYADPGIYVSDTSTPGRIIQASVEHHVRTEFAFNRAANWELFTPQTEEEAGEGLDTVGLSIRDSRNLLIANYHGYRVTRTRQPAPAAVVVANSTDIRFRNMHVNGESGVGTCDPVGCFTFLRLTRFPSENAIRDLTRGIDVREREFAVLDLTGEPAPVQPPAVTTARIDKLADGFFSIGGAVAAPDGTLYFADRHRQKIYAWSEARRLEIVRDQPLDPLNLAMDRSGNLLVQAVSGRQGSVYSFRPGSPDSELTPIPATPAVPHPGAVVALPANWWANGEFRDQLDPATNRYPTLAELFARELATPTEREYVSPDGSVVIPAFRVVEQGPPDYRAMRFSHALDSYGFVAAMPGAEVLVTSGAENRTYAGRVGPKGTITDLRPIANRGGESVVAGPDGRIYVANGQIYMFSRDGQPLGRIDLPERPLQLIFGGSGNRTLYALSHRSLYAVRLP